MGFNNSKLKKHPSKLCQYRKNVGMYAHSEKLWRGLKLVIVVIYELKFHSRLNFFFLVGNNYLFYNIKGG